MVITFYIVLFDFSVNILILGCTVTDFTFLNTELGALLIRADLSNILDESFYLELVGLVV